MATIQHSASSLIVATRGTPIVSVNAAPAPTAEFNSPWIDATGSVPLRGAPNEDVSGWTVGFVQLKFIGTDYTRYRGRTSSQGSMLVTRSNQIVCRDTDEDTPELWYDPIAWGIHGGRGTRQMPAGTRLSATGELTLTSLLQDAPSRHHQATRLNRATRVDNFIHHSEIELHFCTMFVVQEPPARPGATGRFHPIRHFYWNVRFEQMFEPQPSGVPLIGRTRVQEINIQRKIHSGLSNDPRFRGKEFDMRLPISNVVSRRPHRIHEAADWRHT